MDLNLISISNWALTELKAFHSDQKSNSSKYFTEACPFVNKVQYSTIIWLFYSFTCNCFINDVNIFHLHAPRIHISCMTSIGTLWTTRDRGLNAAWHSPHVIHIVLFVCYFCALVQASPQTAGWWLRRRNRGQGNNLSIFQYLLLSFRFWTL